MYLSGTNQTTYEHFRHRYSDAGNPYNVGVLRNCASVFCTQVPKRSELGQLASKAPEPCELCCYVRNARRAASLTHDANDRLTVTGCAACFGL